MRLAGLILAAAAIAAAPPVFAQASPAPLGAGEVLLEVDATGTSTVRADLVMVTVPLTATAPTAAEARKKVLAEVETLVGAARSAGIAEADVKIVNPFDRKLGLISESYERFAAQSAEELPRAAQRSLEIRLRDPPRFDRLREALEAAGADHVGEPSYSLASDRAARRAAKDDAVRMAREEAAAYAQTLGYSVARIVRISERLAVNDFEASRLMLENVLGGGAGVGDQIETRVRVSVDFALVPKH